VSRLAIALRTCVNRWKLHALVPAILEEGTSPVGVELDPLIGSVLSFPFCVWYFLMSVVYPSIMFMGKGFPSTFIGHFKLSNLRRPWSMANWMCCLNTLHPLVWCKGVLYHFLFLSSLGGSITWLGDIHICLSYNNKSNILSHLLTSKSYLSLAI
jgi:hypothetical protein